jgi:uncharacterized protein (TIGR03000 family)
MYSLVLMTAMTTAPSGPEFNGYFRDLFAGRNCSAESRSASCNGCCGGIFCGRIISFFSFGGCNGSCTGRSLASCSGSCAGSLPAYSCTGGLAAAPAFSCTGGGMPSYPTEFGAPYATPMPAYYGGPTTFGCSGGGVPMVPYSTPMPAEPMLPPTRLENTSLGLKNVLPTPGGPAANRATVVVRLPGDAKLYAENQLLELTSGERTFVTPELPTGKEYAYSFKIEYDRNGRTLSEAQKITVTAGKTSTVVFDDLTLGAKPKSGNTAVVAKPDEPTKPVSNEKGVPARITVKVPDNAVLYIDGKKNEKTGGQREFTTPPLPAGKEFSYAMKLETTKDGRAEEVLQKVVFQAGETLTVDFTDATAERRAGK